MDFHAAINRNQAGIGIEAKPEEENTIRKSASSLGKDLITMNLLLKIFAVNDFRIKQKLEILFYLPWTHDLESYQTPFMFVQKGIHS